MGSKRKVITHASKACSYLACLFTFGFELITFSSGNSGCYTYQTVASYLIITFPDSDQGMFPSFLLGGPTGDSVQFGWVIWCNSAPPLTPNGLNTSTSVAPIVLVSKRNYVEVYKACFRSWLNQRRIRGSELSTFCLTHFCVPWYSLACVAPS